VNVAGHVAVAMRLHPARPQIWLGAALPDLAAMGRHRLLGSIDNHDVTRGIQLHHRTDEAFHRHLLFTEPMARLRQVLAVDGVSRGPARAVAHVGPELLLDGELLAESIVDSSVKSAFDEIVSLGSTLATLVAVDKQADWLRHLAQVPEWGLPDDYDDPTSVAIRLHRILDRRPRLAFDQALVSPIASRLAAEQTEIVATSEELVASLVAELAG